MSFLILWPQLTPPSHIRARYIEIQAKLDDYVIQRTDFSCALEYKPQVLPAPVVHGFEVTIPFR